MTSEEIARMREYGKDYSNLTQAYTKSEMFAALDEIERLTAERDAALTEIGRLRGFVEELISKCENPYIRNRHSLFEMCRFLDMIHDAATEALKGGEG